MPNKRSGEPAGAGSLRPEERARREFLTKTGRFAAVTAPAITLLLGTSLNSRAIAQSAGTKPGYGYGDPNHGHSGPPGLANNPNSNAQGPKK